MIFSLAWYGLIFGLGDLTATAQNPAQQRIKQLQEAANRSDGDAQFLLGWEYYQGGNIPPNHDLALHWLRKAAAQGVTGAQLKLGVLAERGIGRLVDVSEAMNFYEQAAKGSNVVAQYKFGMLHLTQNVLTNSHQIGTNWLTLAADQGYAPAQYALGKVYSTIMQEAPVKEGDIAVFWGRAMRGSAYAQFTLSRAYREQDPAESYKWLWLATRQETPATKRQLEKAAQEYSPEAQAEGRRRAEKFVYDPLVSLERQLYEQAAAQGLADAQFQLSQINLVPGSETIAESYKWAMLAAAQEHPQVMSFLRLYDGKYTEEQIKEGTRLITQFSAKNQPMIWQWNEELLFFLTRDNAPAGSFLAKLTSLAGSGDVDAQFRLGLYYLHESSHVLPVTSYGVSSGLFSKSRHILAIEWLEKAAQQGHADAQLHLAMAFLNYPSKEQNTGEARRWLEAAAQTSIEAKYQLALMMESSGIAKSSLADLYKYYRLAAEQGHPLARARLQALLGKMPDTLPPMTTSVTNQISSLPGDVSLKLGIVVLNPALNVPAELLTASLSKVPGVTMLERSQLDHIFAEQALARNQAQDLLKAGQLLSADGLVLLELAPPPATNRFLMKMIAVKPGVIISENWHPVTTEALPEWERIATRQLTQALTKLKVSIADAIPLSILNLRAAVVTRESLDKESQLTWLLTRRLVQQPEFFVLEREKMEKLVEESELSASAMAFWNGSYTLEGIIDRDRVEPGVTSVDVRLTSPKTGAREFRVSGSTAQLPALVEQIMTNITSVLTLKNRQIAALNPMEEAALYFDEARWALRWGLYPEAQRASEASWALGLRHPDLVTWRLRSYVDPAAIGSRGDYPLNSVRRAMALAVEQTRPGMSLQVTNAAVFDAAVEVLAHASRFLTNAAVNPVVVRASPPVLGDLRKMTCELADNIGQIPGRWRVVPETCLARLTLSYAPYWEENFSGSKKRLETFIDQGAFHEILDQLVFGYKPAIPAFSWQPEENSSIDDIMSRWQMGLTGQPGLARPEAGFYLRLAAAKSDYEFEDYLLPFIEFIKEHRAAFVQGQISPNVWKLISDYFQYRGSLSTVQKRLKQENMPEAEKLVDSITQERTYHSMVAKLQDGLAGGKTRWSEIVTIHPLPDFTLEQAEVLEPLLKQLEAKENLPPIIFRELHNKLNLALKPVATTSDTAKPNTRAYVPAPLPPVKDFPYQSNLMTDVHGVMLSRDPKEEVGPYLSIISLGADDRFAWFEFVGKARLSQEPSTISLLRVNLQNLSTISVMLPEDAQPNKTGRQPPPRSLVSHQGEMYLLLESHLLRLDAQGKSWADTGLSLPSSGPLFSIGSRLIAVTDSSVLELDPVKKAAAVLASSRRRPPLHIMDQVGFSSTTSFFAGADGDICAQLGTSLYIYSWKNQNWTQSVGMPDLAKWSLLPGQGGVLYAPRQNFGTVSLKGWTWAEPTPVDFLDVQQVSMGFGFPGRTSKARWLVPEQLANLHRDTMPGSGLVRPVSAHWDKDTLWAVFSMEQRRLRARSPDQILKEHPPFVMIATAARPEPFVCPVKLLPPAGYSMAPEKIVQAIEYSIMDSMLTSRHLVLFAKDIPAMWSVPRDRFDTVLKQELQTAGHTNNLRRGELLQRQEKWRTIFDKNRDGTLDPLEFSAMTNHVIYKKEQEELKKLESITKDSK